MTTSSLDPRSLLIVTGQNRLEALDRRSGAFLWRQTTQFSIRRFVLTEDRVYALTSNGELACFELASGAPLGTVRAVDRGEALLYEDGVLYVVGAEQVAAYDASSGQARWSQPLQPHHGHGLRGAGVLGLVMQPDYDTYNP
ncbi:MAG: PQQ-binding-like beta-propeller repeat protein [Sandaracinaceae bacterium]|nr:PQQ-binding-like beta-propeller repeat protein [Sandaracinaceae bacterium]